MKYSSILTGRFLSAKKLNNNALRTILSAVLVIVGVWIGGQSLLAQSTNDFRSIAAASWNAATTWERYNGSAWVAAGYYPGNGTTNNVTVDHAVAANVIVNLTGTSNLTVNGALSLATSNFSVNGTTTINGSITDGSNTGITTFVGKVSVLGSGTFTSTAVTTAANLVFQNGISQQSTGAISLAAATLSTNAQSIELANNTGNISFTGAMSITAALTVSNLGDGIGAGSVSLGAVTNSANIIVNRPVTFSGALTANENVVLNSPVTFSSAVTIANTKTITNNSQVIVVGTLNGGGATAKWFNQTNSLLEYQNGTAPMSIGVLDVAANGNTVLYKSNANQTIKLTDYYNLTTDVVSGNTSYNRTIQTLSGSFSILGNLTVGQYTSFLSSAAAAIQTLTINGVIANNGTITLQSSATTYCDLVLSGSGDLISGSSASTIRLRNLTVTNGAPKTISYSGNIDFYTGASGNAFTNNGGSFTASAGAFRFLDAFTIAGTGSITFNNLQCGNNNQTIQTLSRDVTVNGTLTLNHSNTLSSYLNLNSTSLSVIGGFIRTNSGEFGGSVLSNLILGNGNTPVVSGTLNFETGVDQLNTLSQNVVTGASYYGIGAPLTVSNLNILSGEFRCILATSNLTITNAFNNNGTYNQTAGTTYFNKAGGTIDIAGSGTHIFYNLQITDGTVTTANNLNVGLNFINNSNAVNSFVASAGAVSFVQTGTASQYIQGAGTGLVSFYNLIFPSQVAARTRYLATNFTVTNFMQIENNNVVAFENSAWRTVDVYNLIVGSGSSGQLTVSSVVGGSVSNPGKHQLNINGRLTVNTGGNFNMRNATTRYADVTFSGAGTLIDGSGTFIFHSILMNNASAKDFNTASNINLYDGANTNDYFTNNGGDFTTTVGNIIFRDNLTDWTLGGTGAIALANLQIGVNTTTNLTLTRDLTVNTNINFNQNLATNYLALNGYTLTLNGNHTRQNNGRIRGGGTSKLVINGSGNFTTSFAFDQATPGTTNHLAQIDYNRAADGVMLLANLMETEVLNLQQGIVNASAGSILVASQANLLNGSFIDNNNTGSNSFYGALNISSTFTFNPTSNSVLNLSGTVNNNGTFNKDGGGATVFTGNTTLAGTTAYSFLNGPLTVNDGVTVVNQSTANDLGVSVVGILNGAGAAAQWTNEGILTYINATMPMATGSLNAVPVGNKVVYSRIQNTQTLKNTTYHHLVVNGGGLRTLSGITGVNGNLTIGEETILYTAEFQINGNATGLLTMMENSELRIGRDVAVAPQPDFPNGFVRANMTFDPVSLVTYNGQNQNLSHEPVYSNLAIAIGYTKTITGDVTVNGYMNIIAGTLSFGSSTPRTMVIYGDLVGSGGRLDMSGGNLAHVLDLYGAVNQVNRFTVPALSSRVRYLSTDNQQVFSPTGGDYYGKLEVQGGSVKFLELDTEVRGELIMTSGIVRLGDKNLTLNSGGASAVPITGTFSATNMIETNGLGKLVKSGSGGTPWGYLLGVYPVGADGKYTPVTIVNLTGSVGTGARNMQIRSVTGRHPSVSTTYDALLRYWDITSTLTSAQANATFGFSPLDVIGDPAKYKAYTWNGSAFTNPASSTIASNTITLPTNTVLTVAGTQVTAYDNVTVRKTLYSYKDGPWDDPDTWTTDPSGQNLEGAAVPSSSDNVVILASRTVYFANNVTSSGLIITISNGGTLDLRDKGFTQTVSVIQGEGTLKLASNLMPPASQNTLVNAGGGTVEYDVADASFVLNNQSVYNNLILNLTNSTNKAILQNNLTVYGNLQIVKGQLQIYKDDASATIYNPIVLDVKKDIIVSADGGILTGTASTCDGNLPPGGTTPGALVTRYYDLYHKVYIGGSLYNQGSVKFISSDITAIDFQNLTTRGAATVRFYGIDNASLECGGTTDFYNLVIDKGAGMAAELAVNASLPSSFRLFGANSYAVFVGGANPELRKALWIRNGTMRLLGSTTIPSLAEGRTVTTNSSYVIPAFGAMIIDSPNATVLSSADSPNEVTAAWGVSCSGVTNTLNYPQEFYVNGRLTVNDGYLSTRFSGGIMFTQLSGEVVLNGGKISTRQIRSTQAGTSSYTQTGGQLELLGAYTYNTSGVISNVSDIRNVPIVYTYNTTRLSGGGTFDLNYSSNIFKVNGGTIDIYNTSGGNTSCAMRILSDATNVESIGGDVIVHITRNVAYDMNVPNGAIPNLTVQKSAGTGTLRLADNLSVNGNLLLQGISELYANVASYQLNVAGDFNIGSTAIYNPNQNTTRFTGSANSLFTVNGTILSDLYGLQIEKTAATVTLAGVNANIKARGDLAIYSGTFDDGGYTVTAKGNLLNSGTHTGTGKILLAEALVNRAIGGNSNGVWGNMELNESTGMLSTLTANQLVKGTFTATAGVFDLSTYSLTLDGTMLPASLSSYSASTMFVTSGNSSDGGLVRKVTADGDWVFPVGTSSGTLRYTPVVASISGYSADGYLQINPVAKELPLLYQGSTEPALQYYWRVRHSNFSAVPNVAYLFGYSPLDVVPADIDSVYVPGKVVGSIRTQLPLLPHLVNTTDKTITYTPAEPLDDASYTAAHPDRFAGSVTVFYSRNGALADANWSDVTTWSETSHTGAVASRVPGDGDIVYIGSDGVNPHYIVADIPVLVGEINFSSVPTGVGLPRLIIPQTGTLNADEITGAGTIVYRVAEGVLPSVSADWGEFLAQTNSQIIYDIQGAGTAVLPAIGSSYPNLSIEASGNTAGDRYIVIDNDFTVKGNLTIEKGASLLLSDGVNGNITVLGNTQIGGSQFGRLLFKGDGNPRTFTCNNLTLTNTGTGASNQLAVQTTASAGLTHNLVVSGNLTQNNGSIDLFTNTTGGSNVDLLFTGSVNTSFNNTGGSVADLYRMVVDKGTSQTSQLTVNTNFTLGAATDLAVKPITLQNGTLTLNNASLNLTLSSGGAFFGIPATSALIMSNGKVSVNADRNGIDLRGKLRIDNNGIVSLGDGSLNIRITLLYQGVTPVLEIADLGKLEVNTEIRRSTNTLAGSLKYHQTGGQVIVYGRDPVYSRAKLEVLNTGSEFVMTGGTLTIVRGSGSTFGDLYLVPSSSSVTGGEIIFSQGTINGNTSYLLNSSVALPNLTITGNTTNNRTATLTLMTLPLQVNQTFKFGNAMARFNTNNRNVTLLGNLQFAGLWTSGASDITYFNGATQTITGSPTLNNVTVNSSTSLTMQPASVLTVNGSLVVNTPQLVDGGNAIVVKKDVANNGAFVNSTPLVATTGLKLKGGVNQKITGSGTFGLVELDNISGATLGNNVSLSNHLTLTRGLFNIGSYLLSLGANANVVSGAAFSSDNMILTDGVYGTTGGLLKTIPSGASSFLFPVGSTGKYTPVLLTVDANATQGTVLVRPVNQPHPTVDDANHVLQYYWVVESNNLSGFSGTMTMNYVQTDVRDVEADYIGARLTGYEWAKFLNIVDDATNKVAFSFTGVTSLSGEYTAGIDAYIPNQVPLFVSVASGDWTDKNIWMRDGGGSVPDGGPFGHRVRIEAGHTVAMSNNSRRVYTTTLNGRLEIGTTYGHNLGTVDGTGELSIATNQLPAGKFDSFFSCTGGTMEYGGTGSYTISDRYNTFKNLVVTGSGIKTLPNATVTVCSNLSVNSGTLKISHFSLGTALKSTYVNGDLSIASSGVLETDVREYVYLKGNLSKLGSSNFKNDYLLQRFILDGAIQQSVSGSFNGANQRFYDLQLSNAQGYSFDGDVEISDYWYNNAGKATMLNNHLFILSKTDGQVSAPSSNNYVAGYLNRKMSSVSANASFAIGKGSLAKPISITERSVNDQYWGAEYFDHSPLDNGYDPESMVAPLTMISNNEFFVVKGPSSATAKITLPLTGTSDIAQLVTNLSDLRIARWNGSQWEIVGGSVTYTGNKTSGTLITQSAVTVDGNNQYYAIATVMPRWQWTGNVSTDWFAGGNWTGGAKPVASSLVTVPNTANKPIVGEGEVALAGSMSLQTGTSLTLNPGARMTVNGAISNTGATLLVKNTVAKPSSLLTYGSIASPIGVEWVYPLGKYIYLGHCVDGSLYTDYSAKSAMIYKVVNNTWVQITASTGFNSTPLEGYAIGFPNSLGTPVTITHTGALRTGNYTYPMGNTWYLIANPYSTYLDVENGGFGLGTAMNTIYVANMGTGAATYATYNIGTHVGVNGGSRYIVPGQSFWVRNYTASSTLSISNTVRTHATGALKAASLVNDVLRLSLSKGSAADETVLVFRAIGSDLFSGTYDSEKRFVTGTAEMSLFTQKDSRKLIINALPESLDTRIVPLFMNIGSANAGTFTLKASNIAEFMPDMNVYLLDKTTGETTNLRDKAEYTFTTAAVSAQNRFELSFAPIHPVVEVPTDIANGKTEDVNITAVGLDNKAIIKVKDASFTGNVTIEVLDALGRLHKRTVSETARTEVDAPNNTQFYMVKVTYKDKVELFKIVTKMD
jgi:hypothetical protein